MSSGGDDALARVHEFERGSVALVADEVRDIPEGWVARTRALPLVWDLNHARVGVAIEPDAAVELVDREMGALPYRHLEIEHEPSGERLEDGFRSAGWKVDRNILMVLRRDPDRGVDTSGVIEAGEEEALQLMHLWHTEALEHDPGPEELAQLAEYGRRTWRARHARRLGVREGDGALAGVTILYSDGVTAQVEDVYVAPDSRGRGLGRALVTRAVDLARELGHEFTFIVGDDNDWPKQLYGKIGFDAVGRTWRFHREAPATPGLR